MPDLLEFDESPLATDFDDIFELFDDMKAFAKANPNHSFFCADDTGINSSPPRLPRFGWVAFLEDQPDDEQLKQWTITLRKAAQSTKGPKGPTLRKACYTREGREALLRSLVEEARHGA